jgi:hypothetical protein
VAARAGAIGLGSFSALWPRPPVESLGVDTTKVALRRASVTSQALCVSGSQFLLVDLADRGQW